MTTRFARGVAACVCVVIGGSCGPPAPVAPTSSSADAPVVAPKSPSTPEPDIVLGGGEWGDADPEDVLAVLLSTARCFEGANAERAVDPLTVDPSPPEWGRPRTLTDAKDGRTQVRLSARDRHWAQFAFQFAHEYFHVLSNHRTPVVSRFVWIKESLCETVSLYALRSMARTWTDVPPYPNWRDYAPSLAKYADERCAQLEHCLPEGTSFSTWLAAQLPALTADGERRAEAVIVAKQLLPVFEGDPDAWRAMRYLHLWDTSRNASIEDYFASWRAAAPARLRGAIERIERSLALAPRPK